MRYHPLVCIQGNEAQRDHVTYPRSHNWPKSVSFQNDTSHCDYLLSVLPPAVMMQSSNIEQPNLSLLLIFLSSLQLKL